MVVCLQNTVSLTVWLCAYRMLCVLDVYGCVLTECCLCPWRVWLCAYRILSVSLTVWLYAYRMLSVSLTCMVVCLQMISYDSPRGGVSVITEKGETTTSFLLIQKAEPSDSGHYECHPSNSEGKSVTVHVLNGKQSSPDWTCRLSHWINKKDIYLCFI